LSSFVNRGISSRLSTVFVAHNVSIFSPSLIISPPKIQPSRGYWVTRINLAAKKKEKAPAAGAGKEGGAAKARTGGKGAPAAESTDEKGKGVKEEEEDEQIDEDEDEDTRKVQKKKTQTTPKAPPKKRTRLPAPVDAATRATPEYKKALRENMAYRAPLFANKHEMNAQLKAQLKEDKLIKQQLFTIARRQEEERIANKLQYHFLRREETTKIRAARTEECARARVSRMAYWNKIHTAEKNERDRIAALVTQSRKERERTQSEARKEFLRALHEECHRWRDSPDELRTYRYSVPTVVGSPPPSKWRQV